jgi:hypothetical protein
MVIGMAAAPSARRHRRDRRAILAELPAEIRALTGPVPVVVRDWPDEDLLDAMEIDDALELTGSTRPCPSASGTRPCRRRSRDDLPLPHADPFEWCERGCPLDESCSTS